MIFCVTGDLDELYDACLTMSHIPMGTAEAQVPALSEVSQDVPFMAQQIIADLANKRGLSTVPYFIERSRLCAATTGLTTNSSTQSCAS